MLKSCRNYRSCSSRLGVSPGVDPVGGSGPPEQLPQVLFDALPQDLAGALALLTAPHHKLVQVRSAAVHGLHGDNGCSVVAGGHRGQKMTGRQ